MNVSIEILEFPLCIKNKILRIKNITKLNIEYIAGKNIVFNNSNLGLNEPHKIIISNDTQKIVLLCYDDDTNLYDAELSRTITIAENRLLIKRKVKKFLNLFSPLFIRVKQLFLTIIFKIVPLHVLKKCGIMVIYENSR